MSKKQPQLSPEKYILTRARTLPIAKCVATKNWEEHKTVMVNVCRQHVNGNYTAGIFLVDLFCLGIKDTHYFFNIPPAELTEMMEEPGLEMEEIDYNLAHNLVYAAHDFAMNFDIHPHKKFSITKYILQEDDDTVPIIEIPVGDEEGKPHLLIDDQLNYLPILKKLEKSAGEGNFSYTFISGDDFDEDDDEEIEEDEEIDDFDFDKASQFSIDELFDLGNNPDFDSLDISIVEAEILFRRLDEAEPGTIEPDSEIFKKQQFKIYSASFVKELDANEAYEEAISDLFGKLQSLPDLNKDPELGKQQVFEMLDNLRENDVVIYALLSYIPLTFYHLYFDEFCSRFGDQAPSFKLFLTLVYLIKPGQSDQRFDSIINAPGIASVISTPGKITSLHHRLFWLIKSTYAIGHNNISQFVHYHNFLRHTGIGGNLKYWYAIKIIAGLQAYLKLENQN